MPESLSNIRIELLDDDEQTEFIKQNLKMVLRGVFRIVKDRELAKDLTQEAFIKAIQRGYQLKDPQKAANWVYKIATNHALDYLRKKKRSFQYIPAVEIESSISSGEENMEGRLIRSETAKMLDSGLATLTKSERTAIILRDVEDVPGEEVAKIMKCNPATVRTHIRNARIKFRKHIEMYQAQQHAA